MNRVPDPVWNCPVDGIGLEGLSLGEQIREPTLLVFLRHFGCIFCREMVADLQDASKNLPGFPSILYVYQGTKIDGEQFFARHHPGASAIADPEKRLYGAFGIKRATFMQGFGPMVWPCAVRAVRKGSGMGRPIGDPWMLPGMFLICPDRTIRWSHPFRHVGDHPDLKTIPRTLNPQSTPV